MFTNISNLWPTQTDSSPTNKIFQKFINAGADAIISNTFFVNHTNLETELNMTEEQASETILGT